MTDSEFKVFCKKIFPVIALLLVTVLVMQVIFFGCAAAEKKAEKDHGSESGDNSDNSDTSNEPQNSDIPQQTDESKEEESKNNIEDPDDFSDVILKKTDDAGQEYIDKIVFIGDSTTYALSYYKKVREDQVWTGYKSGGGTNGTLSLYTTIDKTLIYYPDEKSGITIGEAAAKKKPEIIVITLGLNGGVGDYFEEKQFKASYKKVINAVKNSSPETVILLQNIFPVASNNDNPRITNEKINTANTWIKELARENGLKYLDSNECLIGVDGYMPLNYQSGDGIHMTPAALSILLNYIRTHAYEN